MASNPPSPGLMALVTTSFLFLIANLVTTSKALVTTSVALVTTSKAPVTTSVALVTTSGLCPGMISGLLRVTFGRMLSDPQTYCGKVTCQKEAEARCIGASDVGIPKLSKAFLSAREAVSFVFFLFHVSF